MAPGDVVHRIAREDNWRNGLAPLPNYYPARLLAMQGRSLDMPQ